MTERLSPPDEREMQPTRFEERRRHLLLEIRREQFGASGQHHQTRGRLSRWALVPAAVLLAGATFVALRPAEEVLNGIGCFDAPRTDANVTVVAADGRHPIEVCGQLWQRGEVAGAGSIYAGATPQLTACIAQEAEAVWVFPGKGETFCEDRGLQDLPPAYEEAAARFRAMSEDLQRGINQATTGVCVGGDKARSIARSVLDRHGYIDWSVEGGAYTSDRPCTGLAFEMSRKAVVLVPEQRYQ